LYISNIEDYGFRPTKNDAGQNARNNNLAPNVLYMMMGHRVFCQLCLIQLFHSLQTYK